MSHAVSAQGVGATEPTFHLRLYIAGDAPNSAAAVANLRTICRSYLKDRCRIEIVDVLRDPHRVLQEGVLITPLLVKLAPAPSCRVAGTLSDTDKVVHALGIAGGAA